MDGENDFDLSSKSLIFKLYVEDATYLILFIDWFGRPLSHFGFGDFKCIKNFCSNGCPVV